ncbi:MAG: UDP-N-acetylglucosamine 2-epimerase (non-hydrolyzing) [Crocinitomicaceae bacterium]|nr:UDP-N-acetylglucosamine 2-epimerase (non-hydrolyzing) [Crocinitomicaceae bacterium]MDG1658996.1 UDP-N-acetylglucosamine 2-epimerase (non-hydrolyzing) [Crocinitomicaceae bacterium]|tara:strand:+ start:4196 stop:5344 length:1149 start_codon:yes stop_codon:yes gene_type:complete
MKKIVTIIGARPQIIKSSAISRAVQSDFKEVLEEVIVHTGQHYDENMSKVFFDEMSIPTPNYNLQVGSGSHGVQTAKMIEGLEKIFLDEKPDGVVVYGDTNSTIAGALAAAKIHIPVIHIEAGLRSFNKAMPEEINRIACDHMSSLLFTPTKTGIDNLANEGFSLELAPKATIDSPNVYHCGDIMYDNSLHFSKVANDFQTVMEKESLVKDGFVLMTVHRDSNTDIAENMEAIFTSVNKLSKKYEIEFVLPLHPRTKSKLKTQLSDVAYTEVINNPLIKIIDPVGFMDIIALEQNAGMLVTDSGGLQKESFFFKKPCVILREQTEWIEIVNNGNAILTGADPDKIIEAFDSLYEYNNFTYPEYYGDGNAAKFICQKIVDEIV